MVELSSLSFLIPAYHDEATIEKVVQEAVEIGKKVTKKFEIVVLNDGSRDRTGSRLVSFAKKYKNIRVICHRVNKGYGRTMKELYYAGRHAWLFTIPGDYQIGASELEKMVRTPGSSLRKIDSRWSLPRTLMRGGNDKGGNRPDMVLGWRVRRNDPTNRLFVSWVYNTLLRLLFGVTIHDINSVRLMRRSILQNIKLISSSAFVDAELVIRTEQAGFRVIEIPIAHRPRADGKRGGGNQWRTIWETIVDMVKYACHPRACLP